MKKILNIVSSPRGAASYSIRLAQAVIDKLLITYPGSTVKTTDLVEKGFPHIEQTHLTSFFTPSDNHTPQDKEAIKHSEEAVRDIMEADIIVIGAPMYNFNIHSTLKAWIDHIMRVGVTFSYSEKGPEGLVKGKKVYIVKTSGLIYPEGPQKQADFVEPYLKYALGYMGLTDITIIRAEGTALPGIKDTVLDSTIAGIAV